MPKQRTAIRIPTTGEGSGPYWEFYDSIKSEASKYQYSYNLNRFAVWMEVKTYSELLSAAEDVKNISQKIKDYLKYLKESGVSYSLRNGILSAIRLFYRMNEVATIDWGIINRKLGEHERVYEDRAPTHDEIRRLLGSATMESGIMAVIYLLSCTAMRLGGIIAQHGKNPIYLRIKDLKTVQDEKGENIYRILVYRGSRKEMITFTTPECYKVINEYLDYRVRQGENPGKNELKLESPLIRNPFNPRRFSAWNKEAAIQEENRIKVIENPRPLSHKAMAQHLGKLAVMSGLSKYIPESESNPNAMGRRNEVVRAHGFKKFAIHWMGKAKVDLEIRKVITDHTVGIEKAYLGYDEQDLLDEYCKAIPFLTLHKEKVWEAMAIQAVKEKKEVEVQASVDRGHLHDDYRQELKGKDRDYDELMKKFQWLVDNSDASKGKVKPYIATLELEDRKEMIRQLREKADALEKE